METKRIFEIENFVKFSDEKATVIEIVITPKSSIAVWGVKPGQVISPHTHPDGQDTWVLIKGNLTYQLGGGINQKISAGCITVAEPNQIHGAVNESSENAVFLSIYSAPELDRIPASP